MAQSFFRYPGGKAKFKDSIIQAIHQHNFTEYREPFVGGGSIALNVIDDLHHDFWINDLDIGICCLWQAIAEQPEELTKLVEAFVPTTAEFYRLKQFFFDVPTASNDTDVVTIGFGKLALHQISYSGLGVKSGGPLGGKKQTSDYPINCRWSVSYLVENIRRLHELFARSDALIIRRQSKITCVDFADLMIEAEHSVMLYLDPPYYDKGGELYQHAFTDADHVRLRDLLRVTKHHWVLSYDDVAQVRELYEGWATITSLNAMYSIAKTTRKQELLITPK